MSKLAVGVFGVPGIGKSTLLQDHVALSPSDRHIVGSSIVKRVIAPHSVRDLDTWSEARQADVRAEAIRLLEAERADTHGVLLVDGHFTLRNRGDGRLKCVVTPEDRSFYGAMVLLDGQAEQIQAQLVLDPRKRHGASLLEVAQHLTEERAQAAQTIAEMGVPFVIIESEARADRVAELRRFLDSLRESI